jgi:hypothetical protein
MALSRKRLLTVLAAFTVLFSMMSTLTPAARAAEGSSGAGDVGVMAWTPVISPLAPAPQETVKRNLTGAQRNALLNDCWPGYLCVAVGQGDGRHTVWELYYCTRRSVSNFIDAGGMTNHQNKVAITRGKTLNVVDRIPPDNKKHAFNAYDTWYIDVC